MEANQNNNNEQNNILSSSIQGKYCFSSEEEKFFEGKINEGEKLEIFVNYRYFLFD